jgi:hypothetical protein
MWGVVSVLAVLFFTSSISVASAQGPSSETMESAAAQGLKQIEDLIQQLPAMRDRICARQGNPSACRNDPVFSDLQQAYEAIARANRDQISALRNQDTARFDSALQRVMTLMSRAQGYMRQIQSRYQ